MEGNMFIHVGGSFSVSIEEQTMKNSIETKNLFMTDIAQIQEFWFARIHFK